MYADCVTPSMERAITETERRRQIQDAYNQANGIVPQTVIKSVRDLIEISSASAERKGRSGIKMTKAEKEHPEIINAGRRKRIAKGSGRPIQEVNRLLKQFEDMKKMMKKLLPLLLMAGVLAMSGVQVSCKGSSDTMYERQQSNKSRKIKSNIKVKGTNRSHGHTNRTY